MKSLIRRASKEVKGSRKEKKPPQDFETEMQRVVTSGEKKITVTSQKLFKSTFVECCFPFSKSFLLFKKGTLFSLPEKLNSSTYLTNFYVFLRQSSPPLEKATPSSDLFSYDPMFVIVYFNVQYHDYELRVL